MRLPLCLLLLTPLPLLAMLKCLMSPRPPAHPGRVCPLWLSRALPVHRLILASAPGSAVMVCCPVFTFLPPPPGPGAADGGQRDPALRCGAGIAAVRGDGSTKERGGERVGLLGESVSKCERRSQPASPEVGAGSGEGSGQGSLQRRAASHRCCPRRSHSHSHSRAWLWSSRHVGSAAEQLGSKLSLILAIIFGSYPWPVATVSGRE